MSGETETVEEGDFYSKDTGEYESFDDIGDDTYDEDDAPPQSSMADDEEEEVAPKAMSAKDKKEADKKARGQKGDDMDALDLVSEDEDKGGTKIAVKEEEEEEEVVAEETEKPAAVKGSKPTYVTVDGETYSLDSNALISTPVDGKNEKVSLQELKNNYAGKVSWDRRFNDVNVKEQAVRRSESEFTQKMERMTGVKTQIESIISDVEKNPKDALKIFLDAFDVDSYDLEERMFKSDLTELANVLNMEPSERKAHFLEKRNSHLLNQAEKRRSKDLTEQRHKSYTQKADAIRKSSGVSEAQYVDAHEELISYGYENKDLSENEIVDWAASKPHRESVKTLLTPYKDQFSDDAYGELTWKLAGILRSGTENTDTIKKHLAEVYGVPTEVKQLSKKLNPLGRRSAPSTKPSPTPAKKFEYESFDDLEEDD